MGYPLEEMPLFPLHAVLLPYQTIPLHVFEPRYQVMIRECLDQDRPFGVVLIREGSEANDPLAVPYLVGTSARIINHTELADGRLDLVAVGERRFRVRRLDQSREYLFAHVEAIVEMEWNETPQNMNLLTRVKDAFEMHCRSVFGRQDMNITVQFPDDPVALSFAIAGFIQMPLTAKQRLLELTDTSARFNEMIPFLESQVLESAFFCEPTAVEEFEEYISNN